MEPIGSIRYSRYLGGYGFPQQNTSQDGPKADPTGALIIRIRVLGSFIVCLSYKEPYKNNRGVQCAKRPYTVYIGVFFSNPPS